MAGHYWRPAQKRAPAPQRVNATFAPDELPSQSNLGPNVGDTGGPNNFSRVKRAEFRKNRFVFEFARSFAADSPFVLFTSFAFVVCVCVCWFVCLFVPKELSVFAAATAVFQLCIY